MNFFYNESMGEKLPSFLEIAEDPSFIRWVKHKDPEDTANWEQKLAQYPALQEEVEAARNLVLLLQDSPVPAEDPFLENVWIRIQTSLSHQVSRPKSIRRLKFPFRYAAAAAAAVILLFLAWGLLPFSISWKVGPGNQRLVTLPDYSRVTLNAMSQLTYQSNHWGTFRRTNLDGEAFFRVRPGNTFRVVTPHATVRVLGTSFNVRSRPEGIIVSCHSGKVKVGDARQSIFLSGGQETMKLAGQKLTPARNRPAGISPAWLRGDFRFSNALLRTVLDEFSRQYNMEVFLPKDLETLRLTTTFHNKDRDDALIRILWPHNLKGIEKDGKLFIKKIVAN